MFSFSSKAQTPSCESSTKLLYFSSDSINSCSVFFNSVISWPIIYIKISLSILIKDAWEFIQIIFPSFVIGLNSIGGDTSPLNSNSIIFSIDGKSSGGIIGISLKFFPEKTSLGYPKMSKALLLQSIKFPFLFSKIM